MNETTTYLSPNGQDMTRGDGPATRILVATVEGVATLTRATPDAPWKLTDRSLSHRHIGSMVFEPVSGKLFAGRPSGRRPVGLRRRRGRRLAPTHQRSRPAAHIQPGDPANW